MTLDEFIDELSDLRQVYVAEETPRGLIELAETLIALPDLSAQAIREVLQADPARLPVLVTSVGISKEQLKNQLTHRFGSGSYRKVVSEHGDALITWLCDELKLLPELARDVRRNWTLADVYFERLRWTSRNASRSLARGRTLENDVELIVQASGAPYGMRTSFIGVRGASGPCDFAIPAGGAAAAIVGAVKGFNSTGSKLSDAVREIADIADKRLPRQFVFAVVDGLGWRNRRADLARIVDLYESNAIDGLYTRRMLPQLRMDLAEALRRLGVVRTEKSVS